MLKINRQQKHDLTFDPMFGAAIITEDGQEKPLTADMINEALDNFVRQEELSEKKKKNKH